MSYLVLARKYRPRTFTELSGQEHVVQTLQGAIRTGRVAHAFLFTGARGVGKTTSARLLAMTLQCKEGPTVEPCGKCEACTEITAGNSVDVQEIDGASNNGVDQVRELRDAARYMPSRDRFKIYIIDEVHMLTHPAFNALLKTLEEPPPHVKFVFATTEPHKIPLTILSRTQRFDFRRIPVSKIGARVEEICAAEGITIAPRAVSLVARQAGGSMRDGLSLLDQVVGACGDTVTEEKAEEILGAIDRRAVITLADALIDGQAGVVLEQVAAVHDRGLDLGHLAEELALHLRNLLVAQVGADARLLLDVSEDEKQELIERARQLSSAQLTALFELCQGAVVRVRRAAQPRLTLEVALLSALHLAPTEDLTDLLAELRGRPGTRPAPRSGGDSGGGGERPAPAPARPASSTASDVGAETAATSGIRAARAFCTIS
ncbi:MAG: DNA polymerase III subunit gamma/tau [Deltaproteobacteria bacterium]|nr:DNA polymerase III subunit gamma/tau [Deltaproteobacteria bacterium]